MSEYGYIPESPAQSWRSNKGIFTTNDIYDLTNQDKWTDYGQLDLIETKTASSAVVNFTNLEDYNVHLVTFNNVMLSTDNELLAHRLSNDGGSSFITSGYHFAIQYNSDDGGNGESRDTNYGYLSTLGASGNAVREVKNGYIYYYNLLDSTTFSFCTLHSYSKASVTESLFGGGLHPDNESIDAISFLTSGGNAITSGDFSLYGIKEY